MYNGIGVGSVRGTATSGHVQTNRGHVGAARQRRVYAQNQRTADGSGGAFAVVNAAAKRQGNAEIQFHAAKRQLENDLLVLREDLEGTHVPLLTEDQVEERLDEERTRRLAVLRAKHDERLTRIAAEKDAPPLDVPSVVAATADPAGPKCYNCGKAGHLSRECDQPRQARVPTCFHCGEPGHVARSCSNRSTGQGGDNHQHRQGQQQQQPTNSHVQALRKEARQDRMAAALGLQTNRPEGQAFDFEGQKKRKEQLVKQQEKERLKAEKARRKEERQLERERRRKARKERQEADDGRPKKNKDSRRRRRRSPSTSSSSSNSGSGSSSGSDSESSRSLSSRSEDSRPRRRRRRRSPSSASSATSSSRDSRSRQSFRRSSNKEEVAAPEAKRARRSSSRSRSASPDSSSKRGRHASVEKDAAPRRKEEPDAEKSTPRCDRPARRSSGSSGSSSSSSASSRSSRGSRD